MIARLDTLSIGIAYGKYGDCLCFQWFMFDSMGNKTCVSTCRSIVEIVDPLEIYPLVVRQ